MSYLGLPDANSCVDTVSIRPLSSNAFSNFYHEQYSCRILWNINRKKYILYWPIIQIFKNILKLIRY